MRKIKIFTPIVYYVAFFIINMFNAFVLNQGYFNSNLSTYDTNPLSFLGDFGLLLLVFTLVTFIFKRSRVRVNLLLVITIILSIWCMFLSAFSEIFSMFFSYSQLSSFKNPAQSSLVMEYVTYFLRLFGKWQLLIILLPMVFMIILRFFINTYYAKKLIKKPYKFLSIFSSLVFMIVPLIIMNTGIKNTIHETSMTGVYGTSHVGVYNYYAYSLGEQAFVKEKAEKLSSKKEDVDTYLTEYLKSSEYVNSKQAENKNLIVLQLEAINNFVINKVIDDVEITPNISSLINENYYNNNFYSTAGIGNTSDCEFSSVTGLYPNGNDLSVFTFENENFSTLAKDFQNKGYYTFSIHGNDGEFYNRNTIHTKVLGFNEHIDKKDLLERNPNLSSIKNWISDYDLLQEAVKIYQEQTTPFFSYNILVTSHGPFQSNKSIQHSKFESVTKYANVYLDYVKYVDECVGAFIESLKAASLYDNSVIILYGDHTSSLLQEDVESIVGQELNSFEYRLLMQQVPFLMTNVGTGKVLDESVHSQVDIYQTMASLFNLNNKYCFGSNILSQEKTYVYSPRNLDLIFDDFVIATPSKEVYYRDNIVKLTQAEIDEYIDEFNTHKYYNDLMLKINYDFLND